MIKQGRKLLRSAASREEPITNFACAPCSPLAMSTDNYRHITVDRLRTTVNVTELHEIAVETGCFVAPRSSHCSEILISAVPSAFEGNSECLKLFFQPTGPDSQNHSTLGEPIKSRDGLGGDQRVPLRNNHDAGTQANLGSGGSDVCQPNQRIGNIKVFLTARHSSIFCVGILGCITRRHNHMLNGPN